MLNYKDLGYANGWEETPEELKQCKDKKHQLYCYKETNVITVYYCNHCNIAYKIDSSG